MNVLVAESLLNLEWLLTNPWVQGAIVVVGAIVGAFASGFAAQGTWALLWRELSNSAVFRIRLVGGAIGAIVAYLLLGMPGLPGPGGPGGPGNQQANVQSSPSQPDQSSRPVSRPDQPTTLAKNEIRLVSEREYEAAGKKERFFALQDAPQQPVDAETVLKKIDDLMSKGELKEGDVIRIKSTDQNTSPEFNQVVKDLEKKLKEKKLVVGYN